MSSGEFDAPFKNPIVPKKLGNNDKIKFNCYKGISCFNACCKQADITLTPYDIVRLKTHLGITSGEFIKNHTVPFEMDGHGMPGIKLRTEDEQPICLLLDGDNGCRVYQNRPSSCRYYPMGLMSMLNTDTRADEQHYFVVAESHCSGHNEEREITVADYRKDQQVEDYDEYNRDWYRLILKKRSGGPAVGQPLPLSFQLFFMCSYDVDRFREFLNSKNFRNVYRVDDETFALLNKDDVALMKFGFRLLHQVLFGENTIDLVNDAFDNRMSERGPILAARREREIEAAKEKEAIEKYIED